MSAASLVLPIPLQLFTSTMLWGVSGSMTAQAISSCLDHHLPPRTSQYHATGSRLWTLDLDFRRISDSASSATPVSPKVTRLAPQTPGSTSLGLRVRRSSRLLYPQTGQSLGFDRCTRVVQPTSGRPCPKTRFCALTYYAETVLTGFSGFRFGLLASNGTCSRSALCGKHGRSSSPGGFLQTPAPTQTCEPSPPSHLLG